MSQIKRQNMSFLKAYAKKKKKQLSSKAINSANVGLLKNKLIEFLLSISYSALLEGTNIHRYIKDHNINATSLKASSKSSKMYGNLLCSTCANPFAEFPLSLPKKINSLGPDNFIVWRGAKWEKVAYRPRTGWKGSKDLIPSGDSREAPEGVI